VLLADDGGIKHTRSRVKRVDSGVDTKLGNGTRKDGSCIKVREGGSGSGIGKIIGRDVDGLDRSNRTLGGGGNTLLKSTKIGSEGGLVTDSGRNTTKKGGHLGTCLSETENVIDEEKDILTLLITEVLSNGKTSKSDTSTSTGGLVHLTVDESDLRTGLTNLNDTSLNHFVIKIVTLTSTLTDTSEDRVTTVCLSNVVNKLHDKNGFTDTGTTEKTNLTTTSVRSKKIDDLNTSDKDFFFDTLVHEGRSLTVNRVHVLRVDGTAKIDGLTKDVHDTTKGSITDGNGDGAASSNDGLTTKETIGGVHRNTTNFVVTNVLSDLENEALMVLLDLKSIEDSREVAIRELDIDDGTKNLGDATSSLSISTVLELLSLISTSLLKVNLRLKDGSIREFNVLSSGLGLVSLVTLKSVTLDDVPLGLVVLRDDVSVDLHELSLEPVNSLIEGGVNNSGLVKRTKSRRQLLAGLTSLSLRGVRDLSSIIGEATSGHSN